MSRLKQGFSEASELARNSVIDAATGGSVSGMVGSAKGVAEGVVHAANHVDDVGGVWQAIRDVVGDLWDEAVGCGDEAAELAAAGGAGSRKPPRGEERIWTGSPKHDKNVPDGISKPPTNPEDMLKESHLVKATNPRRRIAYDRSTGEIVIFDHNNVSGFHGHVRSWEDLTQDQQNALIREGLFSPQGRPR